MAIHRAAAERGLLNDNYKTWQLRMHCNLRPPDATPVLFRFKYGVLIKEEKKERKFISKAYYRHTPSDQVIKIQYQYL